MSKCKHKHGLLVLRECGRDTDTRCQNCGKPICADHITRHGNYQVCYDCKSAPMAGAEGADGHTRQAYMRHHYYSDIGYMPLYSRRYRDWDGDYRDGDYDDTDYDTFDGDEAVMGYDDFDDNMGEDDFSDS